MKKLSFILLLITLPLLCLASGLFTTGFLKTLKNGSSAANPGTSCKTIKTNYSSSGDGVYWIDPNGGSISDAFQVYCDMTNDSGGWTLIARMGGVGNNNTSNAYSYDGTYTKFQGDYTWKFSDDIINQITTTYYKMTIEGIEVAATPVLYWIKTGGNFSMTNATNINCNVNISGDFTNPGSAGAPNSYFGLSNYLNTNASPVRCRPTADTIEEWAFLRADQSVNKMYSYQQRYYPSSHTRLYKGNLWGK